MVYQQDGNMPNEGARTTRVREDLEAIPALFAGWRKEAHGCTKVSNQDPQ
jgi:hypothetical protein